MTTYRIIHRTHYDYSAPVNLCRNQACLLPRDTERQRCLNSQLQIDPAPADLRERYDFFGNRLTHFAVQETHRELTVTALSEVSLATEAQSPAAGKGPSWEQTASLLSTDRSKATLAALPFLYDSPQVKSSPKLHAFARPSFPAGRPLLEAVSDLMQRIYQEFTYDPGFTTISTPLREVLKARRGVCQDFAHLGIGCLRTMGLAARYVSGYIETVPPPGQERLAGADASHAWFSVYAGEAGWIDFDPTNNQRPAEQHITVSWGRDFSDVSPLRGVALGGGKHKVTVSVDVERQADKIEETP